MKTKLPSVTVAVCALNEADNIGNFIQSVLNQKQYSYTLQKFLIISDGSTDETGDIVRSFNSPLIEFIEYKQRIGKSSHLNEIYSKLSTDILVQSDADVIFAHENVIADLIRPLVNDKRVGMCGGRPMATSGKTFVEKAINYTFEVYDQMRPLINNGNNTLSVDGRLLAYRKELIKHIVVPSDMIANDAFTYFCCLTKGYEYRYVSTAVVTFRSPQNVRDQIKQNTRFLAAPIRMSKYFDKNLVKREDHVPRWLFYKFSFLQFLKHPVYCSYIKLINIYCKFRAGSAEKILNAKWPMAHTTKNIYSYKEII